MTTTTETNASTGAGPDTFVLTVPDEWIVVNVSRDLPRQVADAMRTALGDAPVDNDVRRRILVVKRLFEQIMQGGLVFAALLDVASPDTPSADGEIAPDTGSAHGSAITAVSWMLTRRAQDMGLDAITFEQLRVALEGNESTHPERRPLTEPELIELRNGPALRTSFTSTTELADTREEVDVLQVRYHALVGTGSGMAILGFSSPNVEVVVDLIRLFDAIAATLEFTNA